MHGSRGISFALAVFAALYCPDRSTAEESSTAISLKLFRERIEPVLKERCYTCHSAQAKELQGGLRLDSPAAARRGGDTGAAIVPGKPGESLILKALRHQDGLEMPPDLPRLADGVIADFERWIDSGAEDPREEGAISSDFEWPESARKHWAFQPVRKPQLPIVGDVPWPQGAADAFILARLEQESLHPSPPANRAVLIRRVTFDLTGLPPTPEAVTAFVADERADAYERLVDRLLASPAFGQRTAQQWLDVVRFAESEGYEYDRHIPDAWRYRDYVIDAFNADLPYDQFLRDQLAGDELNPNDHASLAATVFFRLGPVRRNAGNPDIALSRNEVLTERTDIIGSAVLGLTVGCARCHNHKLEPISQRDYYRLQAYVAATQENNILLAGKEQQQTWERESNRIKEEMSRLQKIARLKTGQERIDLQSQIEALEDQLPPPLPTIPAIANDAAQRTPIHVLRRGVWEHKGDAVGPRPLSILTDSKTPELLADVAHPRTPLANWLTDSEHPLVARVIVNRVWQQHFGVGLVKTANDFGTRSQPPSHPELLDWLAASLLDSGWQLKQLHRAIVLSSTYRQASDQVSSSGRQLDPENRLLSYFPRRRLSAEEMRDAMLAVAGRLNLKSGGPSVITPVDPELVTSLYKPSQWQLTRQASEFDRRSIFLLAKRNLRLPFMEVFDGPALLTSCARRETSTHAPQALELLNGALSNELALAFAERLTDECRGNQDEVVARAFWLAFGRPPTIQERELSARFLRDNSLREFALAIFNLNEFAYVR